ncbi:hypothetical protein FB451DRAFT_1045665 [Mycena latifolia]|nr:hypothetical protein FB451DRAFT_1045665 [Mycena latifolia]
MSTEAELKKLTVPQLKALCKEKRITGYSKLGKDAIIQKLLGTASSAPSTTNPASRDAAPPSTTSAPKKRKPNADGIRPTNTSATPMKAKKITGVTTNSVVTDNTSAAATRQKGKTIAIPIPSALGAGADTISTQTASRMDPAGVPIPPRVEPIALAPLDARPEPTVSKRPSTLTPTDPSPPKKRKITPLPSSKTPATSKFVLPRILATATVIQPPIPSQSAIKLPQAPPKVAQKRFVPLVVHAKKLPLPVPAVVASPPIPSIVPNVAQSETLYYLDFPTAPPPISLPTITLPPSLSQRKRVPRFSLLLSCVADEDLRNCVLVSRMFRYAVYLSAFYRLSRNFAGKRLSAMLAKHPQAMTNMWPYLEQRTQELSTRKQIYASSFLGRLFPSGAGNPISEHLWTSPDHERQIVIAIRFLLTRLFFQVSVGGGKDGKGWTEGQIVDAEQLVQDEVWKITVRHSATSTESFYVVEPTCEPLTATTDSVSLALPVRADWATYIAHRTSVHGSPVPRLLDYLSWTNHEEYHLGISRLWMKRIESEGKTGIAKRLTAERYILACVVSNRRVSSVSFALQVSHGRWMSAPQMAQDFAGLAEGAPARIKASPKVNLFLPAHHHVESLHFTAPARAGMRRVLHSALAVVQTPGREYFILRDNGMQVGCEEDGVAEVWMSILGCDNAGVALCV